MIRVSGDTILMGTQYIKCVGQNTFQSTLPTPSPPHNDDTNKSPEKLTLQIAAPCVYVNKRCPGRHRRADWHVTYRVGLLPRTMFVGRYGTSPLRGRGCRPSPFPCGLRGHPLPCLLVRRRRSIQQNHPRVFVDRFPFAPCTSWDCVANDVVIGKKPPTDLMAETRFNPFIRASLT